jgi:Phosphate-selective porin O and P
MRLTTACLFAATLRAQEPIQFHGLLQGRFTDQQGTPDRLEIRRARLIVMGDPATGLSYKFQADFAKSPYIIDAFLAYRFSSAVTVSAGQMKIPFGGESILNDLLNPPVSRSRAVLGLSPGRDTGVQARDTGVQVSGALQSGRNTPIAEYTAAIFRGQTLISAPKVHYNATAARFVAHPVHGLSFAADWYGSFSAPQNQQKRREELEGEYIRGPLTVRAEQI